MGNYITYETIDVITYPFPNFQFNQINTDIIHSSLGVVAANAHSLNVIGLNFDTRKYILSVTFAQRVLNNRQ